MNCGLCTVHSLWGGVGGLGLVHILDKCVNYYYGTKSAVRIIPILFFSIFDGHALLEYLKVFKDFLIFFLDNDFLFLGRAKACAPVSRFLCPSGRPSFKISLCHTSVM